MQPRWRHPLSKPKKQKKGEHQAVASKKGVMEASEAVKAGTKMKKSAAKDCTEPLQILRASRPRLLLCSKRMQPSSAQSPLQLA